jgi:protein tyrosine phosphatase (PTP) superfamily phosphohydrolase (DUF442 family)
MRIEDVISQSREIFGEEAQLEAVKQDGLTIRYIHNPSEAIKLVAVKQYGNAIRFIHNPSEEVQLEAVKQNGLTIQYIEDPSEEVQLEAVKQNEDSIQFFKKAWLKNIKSKTKLTVSEIEERLGYKVEIIAEK